MKQLCRYPDLVVANVVSNRTQLGRMIKHHDFPKPIQLGPNSVAWYVNEVEDWIESRQVTNTSQRCDSNADAV